MNIFFKRVLLLSIVLMLATGTVFAGGGSGGGGGGSCCGSCYAVYIDYNCNNYVPCSNNATLDQKYYKAIYGRDCGGSECGTPAYIDYSGCGDGSWHTNGCC